jgi:hypothetical protein
MIEILVILLFFGHTTTDWVIQWFHWIMPFPPNDSPTLDQTGNLTMKYQPNSIVYMLPGEHSAVAPNRHITIAANKPIMMPVLWFINGTYYSSSVSDESFIRKANEFFDRQVPTKLFATLDDKPLPIVNVTTPVFRLNIPKYTAFATEEERGGDAWVISKGYWVFLNPLSPGNHTLTYVGATRDYVNGATFHLKVLQ